MRQLKYLPVYFDNEEALSMLSDEERGQLIMALLSAAQGRKTPDLSPAANVAFDFMSKAIARQAIRYKANVENGQKGGAPLGNKNASKVSKINPQPAKTSEKQPTKTMTMTKTNDNDKNEAANTCFIPPRIDEIQAYCAERNNSIDAQRFHNFYEAKGWKIGNQAMQDWRAAVRTWEDRDEKQNHTSPKKEQTNNPFKEMLLEEENEST